jgi:hypothetical protein
MNVYGKIETRSRNPCCCGKAIGITYSAYASVALVIQHVMHMRRIFYLWHPWITTFFQ